MKRIEVVEEGELFELKEECVIDDDAEVYSDVVFFKEGLESFEYEIRD